MVATRDLRLIGLHALLIAAMIQGVTPATYTVVSPWALWRLDRCATAGQPDARLGRLPERDHPAPSDRDDGEETPDEVVLPGDVRAPILLVRWTAIPPARPTWAIDRHAPPPLACPHRAPASSSDPLPALCRMTC